MDDAAADGSIQKKSKNKEMEELGVDSDDDVYGHVFKEGEKVDVL